MFHAPLLKKNKGYAILNIFRLYPYTHIILTFRGWSERDTLVECKTSRVFSSMESEIDSERNNNNFTET